MPIVLYPGVGSRADAVPKRYESVQESRDGVRLGVRANCAYDLTGKAVVSCAINHWLSLRALRIMRNMRIKPTVAVCMVT